jgi:hypothetical protein
MSQQKDPKPISEIIAELRKPASMKHFTCSVFVEGIGDVAIYREIVRKQGLETRFTFEQRGGRNSLFTDFDTIKQNQDISTKVLFFADKDTYVFDGVIPEKYREIHFTNGYSIENDLFVDGKDFLMNELSPDELERFNNLINSVSEWFAFEIALLLSGNNRDAKIDINALNKNVIAQNSHNLEASFLSERRYQPADIELIQKIQNNHAQLLRGKILFEVLLRIAFDRNGIHVKNIETYWNNCIVEGKRNSPNSNVARITNLFSN